MGKFPDFHENLYDEYAAGCHTNFLLVILILSSHPSLSLPTDLFLSGSYISILYAFFICSKYATCPIITYWWDTFWSSSLDLGNILHSPATSSPLCLTLTLHSQALSVGALSLGQETELESHTKQRVQCTRNTNQHTSTHNQWSSTPNGAQNRHHWPKLIMKTTTYFKNIIWLSVCDSIWVWNLVSDSKWGTQTEGVWEQGIWTEERWSDGRLKKTT
jgi:hypothetical protein